MFTETDQTDGDSNTETDPVVERVARALANATGVQWDGLQNYPGDRRHGWREEATSVLRALAAGR